MDVSSVTSSAAAQPSVLATPERPASSSATKKSESEMSIGEKLNALSGIQTEKNLYEDKTKMGKDAFLKMFMEQLKNQDPLNPVKNEQFSQQMAMFSQLEQQISGNKLLEKLVNQQNNMQIAALQLVGKNIIADRGAIYHEQGKMSAFSFKLPQDASDIKIEIQDAAGQTIKSYGLDSRNAGDVSWKWDGTKESGEPAPGGKYTFKVVGKGMDGKEIRVNTKTEGRVSGVTSAGGAVFLMVGEQKVALNDVEMIKEAEKDESAPKNTGALTLPNGLPKNGAAETGPLALGAIKRPSAPVAAAPVEKEWRKPDVGDAFDGDGGDDEGSTAGVATTAAAPAEETEVDRDKARAQAALQMGNPIDGSHINPLLPFGAR